MDKKRTGKSTTRNLLLVSIVSTLAAVAVYTPKSKAEDFRKTVQIYTELDAQIDKSGQYEAKPGLKIGAKLNSGAYIYAKTYFKNDKPRFKINDIDYSAGIGFKKKIENFVPFVEVNYAEKSMGYDIGVGKFITEKFEPYVKIDELFNKNKSDAVAGFEMILNKKLALSAEYTVYTENQDKFGDISITYNF